MVAWAVSLVLVVTWQISAWEGLSPNALGNIVAMSRAGLAAVFCLGLAALLVSCGAARPRYSLRVLARSPPPPAAPPCR